MNLDSTMVLTILGIASVIAVIIVLAIYFERRRTAQMVEYGTALGFTVQQVMPGELDGFSGSTQVMNTGRGRKAHNILRREVAPLDVVLCDYRYIVGSGKHSRTIHQTLAIFRSPRLQTPDFVISPEGFFSRVGAMLGWQDIDFDDSPEFSRKFVLKGSNEEAIRGFLTPERRDLLTTMDRLCLEAFPGCFYFWFDGKRTPPDKLQGFFEKAFSVYSAFAEPAGEHETAG
ncbi:MAG: hypothetical protein JNM43_26375 [Planctomycetaceae bacterium]|nr:hypothetical protein [Planctomycetaceae bacterium]